MDSNRMTIADWQDKRAYAYAFYNGEVSQITKMLANPIYQVNAAQAVQKLTAAQHRLDATFAAIDAEWHASRTEKAS